MGPLHEFVAEEDVYKDMRDEGDLNYLFVSIVDSETEWTQEQVIPG